MADKNGTTVKTVESLIAIAGGVIAILIAISGLELCRRVVLVIFIIASLLAILISLRLREKDRLRKAIQTIDSPPPLPTFKYLAKNHSRLLLLWGVFLLIALSGLILILFPEQVKVLPICGNSAPTPDPSPAPTAALSEASVDFIVKFKAGNQLKIPAGGTLTLLPGEDIVIDANVVSAGGSPFPGDLIYQVYFSSGEVIPGATAIYTAPGSGADILALWVKDKTSGDEITRSIRIVVK